MNSHIARFVGTSLGRNGLASYESAAAPVIKDLEDHAFTIACRVIDAAVGEGVDRSDAEEFCIGLGLYERPVPPAPAPAPAAPSEAVTPGESATEGVSSLLTDLAEQVAALTQVVENARRQGYRI